MASAVTRILALAAVVGSVAVVALGAAVAIRSTGSAIVPVTSITALFLLGSKPLLDRLACWAVGARGPIVGAAALAGAAPIFLCGAHDMLAGSLRSWRPGFEMSRATLELLVPPMVFGWMVLSTLVAALLFGRESRVVDAALARLRTLAIAAGAALLAATLVRAARAPDPDQWLEAPFATAWITPRFGPPGLPCDEEIVVSVRARWRPVHDEDIAPESACPVAGLRATLVPQSPEEEAMDRDEAWEGDRGWLSTVAGRMVTMHHDETRHAWRIRAEWWFRREGEYNRDWRNLEGAASTASAPRGWIAGLAAGLLVAALAWLKRRGVVGRLRQITEALEGTLGENGWISFEGGTAPVRAPEGLAKGPVILLARTASKGTAYQSDGAAEGVIFVSGTRAAHAAAVQREMVALDTRAIASVVLTAGPVVAAAMMGLVA